MLPKPWFYYLLDEHGRSYTIINGVVTTRAVPTPLVSTPDGWQEILIGWERNMSKVGMVRNFSLPLGFVGDGLTILRTLAYKYGIDHKVYLLIQRLEVEVDDDYYYDVHKYFYRGEIDLSGLKDEDQKFTVNIMEGGTSKFLKANEGTSYEVPLEGDPDAILVKLDGIFLREKHSWLIPQSGIEPGDTLVGTQFIVKEGTAFGFASFSTFTKPFSSVDLSIDYFAAAAQDIANVRFHGKLPVAAVQNSKLQIVNQDGVVRATLIDVVDPGGVNAEVPFDVTCNLVEGDKLFLKFDQPTVVAWTEGEIHAEFKSRKAATYVWCHYADILGKRLTKKITNSEDDFHSDLLLSRRDVVITCGDALRGIVWAKIKTKMNEYLEFCRVIHGAGVGIEGKVIRVEPFAYFLTPSSIQQLGEARDFKTVPANDLHFNTIKFGYQPPQIDDVNGKFEFCATYTMTTPRLRVVKELALVCPYQAAPYYQEITRVNLEGKATTDDSSDNEVMLLSIDIDNPQVDPELGTYYLLKRPAYDSIEGEVDHDSVYNIELSPRRILRTHKPWINSCLYEFVSQTMKYQTSDKNSTLKTVLNGEVFDEDGDETIGEEILFLPWYFEFDTMVPVNLVDIEESDPNTGFATDWYDKNFEGILIKAAIAPNDDKEQVFKLLATKDTQLENLIIS